MDFTPNRNTPASARTTSAAGGAPTSKKDATWKASPGWLKAVWLVLLFAGAVLMAGIITLLIVGGNRSEAGLVDEDKYQAVFLDNNQVYFGKVKTINDRYIDLQGIYYLTTDQSVQPKEESEQQESSIRLQPLGCELHGPTNQMVINREHVTFWENLKKEGTVTQAITQWLEQNPEGLKCDTGQTNNNDSSSSEEGQEEPTEEQNQEENNQ